MPVWPNGKSTPPTVTSPYGYSPGYDGMHWGLDTIGHYYNHAIDSGVVIHVGWNSFGDHRGGGGWEVWYRLDTGHVIVSYHQRRGLLVAKGDRVVAGSRLGIQSNTGYAFGIHCHTEVWLNGRRDSRTDPYEFIRTLIGLSQAADAVSRFSTKGDQSMQFLKHPTDSVWYVLTGDFGFRRIYEHSEAVEIKKAVGRGARKVSREFLIAEDKRRASARAAFIADIAKAVAPPKRLAE